MTLQLLIWNDYQCVARIRVSGDGETVVDRVGTNIRISMIEENLDDYADKSRQATSRQETAGRQEANGRAGNG